MSVDPMDDIDRELAEQAGVGEEFEWAGLAGPEHIVDRPMVVAPDIILDLVFAREDRAFDAARFFDAIAQDVSAGVTTRKAYVAQTTLPEVYATVLDAAGGCRRRA